MKTKKVHQLVAITFLHHKPCGNKIVVDHIDNNKSNNFLSNLQLVTNRENTSKDKVGGTSSYIGVSFITKTKKWKSSIGINGKDTHLGFYDNEIDAANAYQSALRELNTNRK